MHREEFSEVDSSGDSSSDEESLSMGEDESDADDMVDSTVNVSHPELHIEYIRVGRDRLVSS